MIRYRARAENPETVEVSITLTMSLKDWREAYKQLSGEYPSWAIGRAVREAIGEYDVKIAGEIGGAH